MPSIRALAPLLLAPLVLALPVLAPLVLALPVSVALAEQPLTAQESDPRVQGWMVGTPPAADRVISAADHDATRFPKLRWTACHVRELNPTAQISRGLGAATPLAAKPDGAIDALAFTPVGASAPMTWEQSLAANYTDGIVILHKGVIVYERYTGCLDEMGQHAAMSVTKSMIGLLGEALAAEGTLDETARVASLVPELAGSAFGDATVRQVLDMTTGLAYSENYADPKADIWRYIAAGSPLPPPAGPRGYLDFLKTVVKAGEHGPAFAYKTVNTDALGWIIARVTGKPVSTLLSQRIWQRIGAEQDAYIMMDSVGTPFAGGGLSLGLRDLARVGQMMLDDGKVQGQQVIPAAAVASIRGGGDKAAFEKSGYAGLKGWSYRGMWWVSHNAHGAYMARGIHGQSLYIDPTAQMVIARFGSHPVAANAANDPTTLPAFQAVAEHLMR